MENGALITFRGMEDIAAQEVHEKIQRKAILHNSFVVFHYEKEELTTLAYQTQTARHIVQVLGSLKHKNENREKLIPKLFASLDKNLLKKTFTPTTKLHINCVKENYTTDMSSPDLAALLAQEIIE